MRYSSRALQLRITHALPGTVKFELDIQKQHTVCCQNDRTSQSIQLTNSQNRLNIIHGGTIASLVDLGGSLAVASMGCYNTGVTTDLNGECTRLCRIETSLAERSLVSYLRSGGKAGEKIVGVAECEKFGQTLAFTHISFFNEKGELAARGSHTK